MNSPGVKGLAPALFGVCVGVGQLNCDQSSVSFGDHFAVEASSGLSDVERTPTSKAGAKSFLPFLVVKLLTAGKHEKQLCGRQGIVYY